jgi:hypothetical protein
MKSLLIVAAALALAVSAESPAIESPDQEAGVQVAVTCSKTKEEFTGKRRICYYDCLGTARAISIPAIQECPLSIER